MRSAVESSSLILMLLDFLFERCYLMRDQFSLYYNCWFHSGRRLPVCQVNLSKITYPIDRHIPRLLYNTELYDSVLSRSDLIAISIYVIFLCSFKEKCSEQKPISTWLFGVSKVTRQDRSR